MIPAWWNVLGSATLLESILVQVLAHVTRCVAGLLQMSSIGVQLGVFLPVVRCTVAVNSVVDRAVVVNVVACARRSHTLAQHSRLDKTQAASSQ